MENSNVRSRFNNQNRTKNISKEQNRNDNLDSNQKLKNQELNQEQNKQYLQLCLKITAVAIAFTLAIAVIAAVAMVIWYIPSLYWTLTEFLSKSKTNVTCKLPQLDKVCGRSYAEGNGLKVAMVGENATAFLWARTCTLCEFGEDGTAFLVEEEEETVICDLESQRNSNSTIKCSAKRIGTEDCRYRISYQLKERGNYMLNIKVKGEHIKGSPFLVTVVRNMSVPVRNLSGLTSPHGIAFNKNGDIIVTEYKGHNFKIFHPSGSSKPFGSKGSGEGEFKHPSGVAVDDDGKILVADRKNNRLQQFTSEGEFMKEVKMDFNFPTGIGIHPYTKDIYVTELDGNKVKILNPDFSHKKTIGTNSTRMFHQPQDVAFDSRGYVYIADNENNTIQVFTADGEFRTKFGKLHDGDTTFELNYPTAICIDSYDIIYVVELHKYCVSLFRNREGSKKYEYLTSFFGKEGSGPGEFKMPRGIAIDKSGLLYVSDHNNNIVQVF